MNKPDMNDPCARCGHVYGDHSSGLKGRCVHDVTACGCPHFIPMADVIKRVLEGMRAKEQTPTPGGGRTGAGEVNEYTEEAVNRHPS